MWFIVQMHVTHSVFFGHSHYTLLFIYALKPRKWHRFHLPPQKIAIFGTQKNKM